MSQIRTIGSRGPWGAFLWALFAGIGLYACGGGGSDIVTSDSPVQITSNIPSFSSVSPLATNVTTTTIIVPGPGQFAGAPIAIAGAIAGAGQLTLSIANTTPGGALIVTSGSPVQITSNIPSFGSVSTVAINATATTIVVPGPATPPVIPPVVTGSVSTVGGVLPSPCTTTAVTGTASAITLPSMAAVPSRFSGVAPLAVFFDATGTATIPATPSPFHNLEYRWTFGDPAGGATWGRGSRANISKNSATGPLAAHVFETPGSYIVNLTVLDGTNTVSNSCIQIAVSSADALFAGTNTICFSTAGNFTGCPSGAQTITDATGNFKTAIDNNLATGKRLLFRRGETWTAASAARLQANGPGIVGAFGAGALPIVQSTGNTSILGISGSSTPNMGDWRVMDLEFDGMGTGNSIGVVAGGGANQLTFLRMNIHDVYYGLLFFPPPLDGLNGCAAPPCPPPLPTDHHVWNQLFVVDSTIQRMITGGGGGSGMYLGAERLALLGNFVNDSTNAEHVLRLQWIKNGVIQANDMGLPRAGKVVLTIRALSVGAGGVTGSNATENVIITDNLFRGGLSSSAVVFSPDSSAEDERLRNFIFDGNFIRAGAGSLVTVGLRSSVDEVTARNNIFDLTGGVGFSCMRFEQSGAEPPHTGIRVFNNTCFTNAAGPTQLIGVYLDNTNTNVTVANNLGYAPNQGALAPLMVFNAGSTGVTGGSGTFGNSSDAQINTTSPNFVNAGGANAGDYAVNTPSYAINGGVAVPVFSDLFRAGRPLSGYDIGAAER